MPVRQKLRSRPNPPGDIRKLLGGKVKKGIATPKTGDPKVAGTKRKLVDDDVEHLPQAKRSNTSICDPVKSNLNSRKRKAPEEDGEVEGVARKARKDKAETGLPQSLQDIVDLHSCLLKAISLHFAHHGPTAPAELSTLLASATRLYKKREIVRDDIRRLLALDEISIEESISDCSKIVFKKGKLRLSQFGAGRPRISIEYIGNNSKCNTAASAFDEQSLQLSFLQHITTLHSSSKKVEHLQFLNGAIEGFPLIRYEALVQEATHRAKAKQRRAEILSAATLAQPKQSELPTPPSTPDLCPPELNSRKSSLLSRIQARQLAKAGTHQPTASEVLRSHALGRLEEVIGTLRMMHKLKSRGGKMTKVSFSMEQLDQTIRDSARVPLGGDEVKMCLRILAEESASGWVKLIKGVGVGDGTEFVVLDGLGLQGDEARRWIRSLETRREDVPMTKFDGMKHVGLDIGLKKLCVS
ncbi:MAG: hypothetical protein Q9160_000706 [Pyrenula sp. 1 TL-2023]